MWPFRRHTIKKHQLLFQAARMWKKNNAPRLAGSLAFYSIIALPALLIFVISGLAIIIEEVTIKDALLTRIDLILTPTTATTIKKLITSLPTNSVNSLSAIISAAVVLWSATNVFAQMKRALNDMWDIVPKPPSTIRAFFLDRLLAFLVILLLGTLFAGVVVAGNGIALVADVIAQFITVPPILFQLLSYSIMFIVATGFLTLLYTYLPDARVRWRDAVIGAVLVSLLFVVGNLGMSFYLSNAGVVSVYGAAGSIIALLLWLYYSALIFFFGAALTRIYAKHFGAPIKPAHDAKRRHDIHLPF